MGVMRLLTCALLLLSSMLLVACDSGAGTALEEQSPEDQAKMEELRKGYAESGRYGPGGQNTPTPAETPAEGDAPQ